jgi:hypothetical protein
VLLALQYAPNRCCFKLRCHLLVGTSRWGEFGEGGLLWGECRGKSFEWFDGSPIEELLCKVCESVTAVSYFLFKRTIRSVSL